MTRRTTKTPAQIAEEMQKRAAAATARAARTAAEENPVMQELNQVRDSYSKDINAFSRQLKGPQSFDSRRTGFQLRIANINAEEAFVNAADVHARACRQYLDSAIDQLALRIANGETVTDADLNDILLAMPERAANWQDLVDAVAETAAASDAFIEQKKAKKITEVTAEASTEAGA